MKQSTTKSGIYQRTVLAEELLKKRSFVQAETICTQLIKQAKSYEMPYWLMGMSKCEQGHFKEAVSWFKKSVEINCEFARAHVFLAKSYLMLNQIEKAKVAIAGARDLEVGDVFTLDTMGTIYSRLGMHESAASAYYKATSKAPENAHFWFNLGATQRFLGLLKDASDSLKKCIALDFKHVQAHALLSEVTRATPECNNIAELQELLKTRLSNRDNLILSHALAKELAAVEKFEESFDTLEKAKEKRREELNYSFSLDTERFN